MSQKEKLSLNTLTDRGGGASESKGIRDPLKMDRDGNKQKYVTR